MKVSNVNYVKVNNVNLVEVVQNLLEQIHVIEHKVSTLEILSGKHVCWCGPTEANPNKCMICYRHINNPTVGDCGCPNGYCTCSH